MSKEDEAWTERCWRTSVVASWVRVTPRTIRNWLYSGRLRYYRIGSEYMVNLDDAIAVARMKRGLPFEQPSLSR